MLAKIGILVPGRGAWIALAFLAVMAPVPTAAKSDWAVLRVTQSQLGLTQQMTQGILLIALGVEKEANADMLRKDREVFERFLQLLRDGDLKLKLSAITDPQHLRMLTNVEALWGKFVQEIEQGLEAGRFDRARVTAIMRHEAPLVNAVRQFALTYKKDAPELQVHSLHLNTKAVVEEQPLLARFMLKNFLLIAYNHEVKQTRMALTKSYSQLDRSFQALLYGDSELQLIAAPTPAIEAQIEKAQGLWRDFQPIIKTAAEGGKIDKTQVAKVAAGYRPMLMAIEETVVMY